MENRSLELIDVPLWQLEEPLLDVLELVLGGLLPNSELASRLLAEYTEYFLNAPPSRYQALLADPDGTGLALLKWEFSDAVGEAAPIITELRALAEPEHGMFRNLRVTGTLGDAPVVLFSATPSLAELAELRARDVVVPGTVFLLVVTAPPGGTAAVASQVRELEHAAELFDGVRTGYLVIPAGVDQDPVIERLSSQVVADLQTSVPAPAAPGGTVVMFSGLSGSGKSTLARAVQQQIQVDLQQRAILLDGDDIRRFISKGLGFSREDRETNVERIGWIGARISEAGGIALCAPIAPFANTRGAVRELAAAVGNFLLIHISTPLEVCEDRDRKGLYAKARAGLLKDFTGIDSPYEVPVDADLQLDLSLLSIPEAAGQVMELLRTLQAT